ncbi:helix-turn-helix transcriptional regulator [Streptomyces zagrosensis]|uniref:DNA-binding CsgD family transcriptional regulator/tetratricopeptide (TPR) repeat protein n=1 Tax=Streptomyces zagrosensis TaxID=1042984 RepID=A0A7W9Q7I0_9ACTN|nr:LuxR family transcriptional regulator [Streptomyces zagrosensis]MBB5935051.1 DNA-binding CsgD family transcriptional regulator/tetratricopeptide (TPR) repeat protein [Streptomyces zagrosensis]
MTSSILRRSGAPVLVGRTGELHTLLDAIIHPPSVALVEGEAGIGKSRLIREALAHPSVRGRRILPGTCHPLREPFPYGPFFDLLRQLEGRVPSGLNPVCGSLRPYLPELADALPPAPEALQDHRSRQHRLFRAVRALLEPLGQVVVIVEDLHWADDGTRDLVRFLVDDPPAGVSVVLSYRREDLPGAGLPLGRAYRHPPGTTSVLIPLQPLDVPAVRSLTAAITGSAAVPTRLAAELHERTAGIPFVLEEVVRALSGDGFPAGWNPARETLDAMEVPTLLREAMVDRMTALSPDAMAVVQAAAVLRIPAAEDLIATVVCGEPRSTEPRPFGGAEPARVRGAEAGAAAAAAPGTEANEDTDLDAAGLAGGDLDTTELESFGAPELPGGGGGGGADAGSGIREALLAGVLFDFGGDRYGFRHSLAQQAVYSSLPGVDRRRLHRRVMAALAAADPPPLVQLAYHARQAGDLDVWLRHSEAAADAARELGDIAVAVEILEGLLSDPELRIGDRARLAVQLSRAAVIGLAYRRAAGLLRRIVRDGDMPDAVRGEIRLNLGLLLNNQAGNYEQGRVDTEIAVEELRDYPALAARGMAALAMASWGEHPYSVYQLWIARAEALVADQSDPALRLAVRGNHVTLLMMAGDPTAWARAKELMGAGQTIAERLQIARLSGNLAEATTWLGHYPAAQKFRHRGQRLAAECGAPFLQGIIDGTSLRLEWSIGNWQGLAERARRVLDVVQGVSGISADAHLVLGLLAIARGEWDEATAELDAAALGDPANAPAPILAAAAGAMTRVRVARGELEAGRAEAERAVARVRRKEMWVWGADLMPMAVAALVRCGRVTEAEALVSEYAAGIANCDAPLAIAALDACRGTVAYARGCWTTAIDAFETASARYAALPRPYSAARTAEAAVRCRLDAGISSGRASLDGLGATVEVEGLTGAAGTADLSGAVGVDHPGDVLGTGGPLGGVTESAGSGGSAGLGGSADLGGAAGLGSVEHKLGAQLAAELTDLAERFAALGATRDAARCRRVLRGNGVSTPSRRGRRGYGDQLSPREKEVARLVALGHTNREIADVLFLSPRTVEQHVAKVLRKLNVTSRNEVPGGS